MSSLEKIEEVLKEFRVQVYQVAGDMKKKKSFKIYIKKIKLTFVFTLLPPCRVSIGCFLYWFLDAAHITCVVGLHQTSLIFTHRIPCQLSLHTMVKVENISLLAATHSQTPR